jgi:ubiquinone/menaquinone biosynthesis C-methylase UbiE
MLSHAEKFLIDFHAACPGATAEAFGTLAVRFREQDFASSYDVLAAAVPRQGPHLAVLDLGCGSGFLLSLLAAREQAGLDLIGVDMSAAELRIAAADLGGRASLVEARAQALPLATGSVDVTLCHMALMLMRDVDGVLAEITRVLKAEGVFAAVVGGPTPPSPAFEAYLRVLDRHARASFLRFGDTRFRAENGIREMFAERLRDVRIDEIHIRRKLTPEQTWAWFMRMYDIHQIAESQRTEIEREYLSSVAPHCDADGQLDFPQTLRCIEARAA